MIPPPAQASAPVRQSNTFVARSLGWIVLAVPVVAFVYVWYRYAVNVPKWDDHALKAFLLNLEHETTLTGKIYQVFRQHNEHRIVWDRLITWLDYTLFGELNYVRLMAVGNLGLAGLLAIFGLVLRQSGRSVWYVVPVACLLFNLAQWENMFWGMAALQNFTVLAWVATSIYLLTYTRHWPAGLGTAVLTTITGGNGMIVWPVTLAILLHKTLAQPPAARNWQPLMVQTVGAVLCISLYFTGYEKPAVTPSPRVGFAELLRGWLAFNGSAAEAFPIGPVVGNCVLLGGLIIAALVIFGVSFLRQTPLHRPWPPVAYFFWGMMGFLLATGLIVTWSRVGFGFETLITSRYKIYSLTALALLYVYGAATLPKPVRQITLGVGWVLGGALAWLSYPAYADNAYRLQQYLLTSQFNWTYTQNRPVSTIDPQTARLIENAPAPYDYCLTGIFGPANAPMLALDTLFRAGSDFVLAVAKPPATTAGATVYVRLRTEERTFLAPTDPDLNPGRWAKLGLTSRFQLGFTSVIQQPDARGGTYAVDVLAVSPGRSCTIYPTGQHVTFAKAAASTTHTNW